MAKKERKPMIRCLDCRKGTFMKWDNNPVIVSCPYIGKDVASIHRSCIHFERNPNEPTIIKKTHWP